MALALGLAACSSTSASSTGAAGSGTSAAARAVRQASTRTLATGSAAVALRVTSDEHAGGSTPISVDVLGAFDFTKQQGEGRITFGGLPATVGGTSSPEIVYTLAGLYLQASGVFKQLASGKPWVQIDASSLGSIFGSAASSHGGSLDALASALIASPTSTLGIFDTPALTASVLGHPTVNGQRSTEYAVTIRPQTAAADTSGIARALYQSLGKGDLALTVWLDGQGRIIQVADQQPPPRSAGSSGGAITGVVVDLANFGQPVSVTVPPASEVSSPSSAVSSPSPAGATASSAGSGG